MKNFKKCLSLDSTYFNAMIGLSITYYLKENKEEAKNYINKAISIEPRLAEGVSGIKKLKEEDWPYTEEDKLILKKIFELIGK